MKKDLLEKIEGMRHFNRFYTKQIGILNEGLLESPFSLTEARVIYELAHREKATATELGNELGLDAGYLSRTVRDFEKRKLIVKKPSEKDARQSVLSLTARGRKEFESLNRLSRNQIEGILNNLSPVEQNNLLAAMTRIENLLGAKPKEEKFSYVLRPPQAGDMGWVVQSNGILYAQEYGWDENYEALVAQIVADFVKNYDSKKERCWIAEKDGENIGSVFLVKESERAAKLRLLIVDPKARGLGIGKRLVDECTRFARQVGYKKITLWTNSVLLAARSIYQKAGYELVKSETHHSFGRDLVGETWELKL
ncbi:MAG: MarR family transcriptional regulator [Acidobacteria bacterium]|nr:MarR family transcriptional regulator [Acidobacteriota bacterium]